MGTFTLQNLRDHATGEVITADSPGYDEARRVHNAMIDRRPRAVVRCADAADVQLAVRFARENGLDLAVRGGGHSVPGFGTCDDGVVVDLSPMRAVEVDPTNRTARAQGGARWREFNAATYPFGLATTGGIISTTGVSGLTLGGGIGYLDRALGLSCDNLRAAEVVTADGRLLRASEKEHEDLFWALRGGGGNFGIATSLTFALSPVRDIHGGPMFFDIERAGDVLRVYRDFIRTAPEEFGGFPAFQIAPPLPFIPPERHGTPLIGYVTCWTGPPEQAEAALAPLREAGPVVAEMVGRMPYPDLNSAFDELVGPGLQHYWKAAFATDLTDGAIEAHLRHGPGLPAVNSTVHLYPINGACHRVDAEATAFNYRDASYATVIAGMWPDPADNEANVRWVRDYYDDLAPHSARGGYVNFMAGDDQEKVRDNYRGNYDRLVEVKRAYDPENLFHLNQNIIP
jgi:FAD/FMN-containing dehydrogenase